MNIILEATIKIIANIFDFIMLYFLAHQLIKKDVQLSAKELLIGCAYGLTMGIVATFLHGYAYRSIVTIGMLFVIKYVTKKKLHELLILYVLIFACISLIQIIVLSVISYIPLNYLYISLTNQVLSTLLIILVYGKLPIHKLLFVIEKELLLKLLLFILIGMFLIVMIYSEDDYTDIRVYSAYFGIFIIMLLMGLYQTIKRILFYTNKVPMQLHDVKNVLMGLYISTNSTEDVNAIRTEINKSLQIIGLEKPKETIVYNNYNQNILTFINQKNRFNIPLITDVRFFEPNMDIPLSVMLYMLGSLLDNALESGTRKPIYIKVVVAEESIELSVANEYQRTSTDDFNNMFKQGYSTKASSGRGYGLPNLNKIVTEYKGEILIDYSYNKENKCDYLNMIIHIKTVGTN